MSTTTLNTNDSPLCFLLPSGVYSKTPISYWDTISNPANLTLPNSAALGTTTALPEFEVATTETYPPYAQDQGYSGAPVFNSDWELVGIFRHTHPTTTFALPDELSELRSKLHQWFLNCDFPRLSPTTHISDAQNRDRLYEEAQAIFRVAAHEIFEYGMESDFINDLEAYVGKHGLKAIQNIARIVLEAQMKPQVVAEALRWLGSIDHQQSRLLRLRILEMCLSSPSRWIRDAAAQGLDDLSDPHAISYLETAISRERIPELRRDLERVLIQLERSK